MYIKKSILEDINSFTIVNEFIYVVKEKNSIYKVFNADNIFIYRHNEWLQHIKSYKDIIFTTDFYSNGIIINRNEISKLDGCYVYEFLNEKDFLVAHDYKTHKYNISNELKEFIWEERISIYLVKNDCIYARINEVVKCFSLNEHHLYWEYDIKGIGRYIPFLGKEEREGEVMSFIGIYKGVLVVLLKGGKFISLDEATGKLLWEKNKVDNTYSHQNKSFDFGDPYYPHFDEQKGIIYMLQGEAFILFDLNTMIATYEWNSIDLPADDYIFVIQSILYKNQIYFVGWNKKSLGSSNTIGIFDISTRKAIWQYTFDFEKDNFIPTGKEQIQVNDTHLYVLDWKNQLHIFERTEN